MDFITPGPRDRVIEPDASGTVYIHRAGDAKRRKLLREFEADQLEKQRNDPAHVERREKEVTDGIRGRLEAAVSAALSGVDRVKALRIRLVNDRDEARNSARNLRDPAEAAAALSEADAHERRLRQLPATLDKAKSDLREARDALAAHDARVAARVADRAAGAADRAALAEREAAARAAAERLYAELMADPAPKPIAMKKNK